MASILPGKHNLEDMIQLKCSNGSNGAESWHFDGKLDSSFPSLVSTSCLWPGPLDLPSLPKKGCFWTKISHPVGAVASLRKKNKADSWWKKMKVKNIRKACEGLPAQTSVHGRRREKEERVGKGK